MKSVFTCCAIIGISFISSAQSFEISPKISLGTGRIYSKNLTDNLNQRNALDKDILTWDIKQKFGFTFGMGGCFQYNFNDKLSILVEPAYNHMSQKVFIDYIENKLDGGGDGDIKTITSAIKIKSSWLGLPLLVQFGFGKNNIMRVSGGFEFLFISQPKIESSETKITETYKNNNLDKTKTEIADINSTINVFNSPRTSFLFSLGTTFLIAEHNLYIDFRYHLPITKSQMYTTDGVYDNVVFKNSEVYDIWGKSDAENDAPQFRLNDFKLSTFDVSFKYVLFKK